MKNENKFWVDASHVIKSFGQKEVLKDVSIKIKKGDIFGLLGPSGAGKTTLIKILTGQLKPDKGTAAVFGKNVTQFTNAEYSKFGMVLDNSGLYGRLSCKDNLVLFAEIYGIPKNTVKEALQKVSLLEAWKRPVNKLSKGMKQRLVFARAIMHDPDILFLDEPTSGLDPSTASQIHKLIRELREKGKTIFLTTHNMEEAHKLCDQVALLNNGEIVEYGSPDEICRRYNEQNKIHILLKSGERLALQNEKESADRIAGYLRQEQIESIHSSEPNLETVFIELTGTDLAQ